MRAVAPPKRCPVQPLDCASPMAPALTQELDEEPGEDHEDELDSEESDASPTLAPEVRARREAALRHVRSFGDPALRSRALAVERFDVRLHDEVDHMGRLMRDSLGIGLAATQLGVLHRVLVYRVESGSPVIGLVNPSVLWSGREKEIMEEGCLSLPGVHVDVDRPVYVRVGALSPDGDELTIEASGLEARVLQHEIDHLDGVLILDRTTREQRKEAIRTLREATAD